ncbi:hypothetical protein [Parolsenella catena]|uniref:hypothetical protein n=1 Tax=Parolsenella catena TaxID=2003188 RepID=UPI003C6E9CBA
MIPGSKENHPSFRKSFGFAFQGFRFAVMSERNIKVMLAGFALAVVMGLVQAWMPCAGRSCFCAAASCCAPSF